MNTPSLSNLRAPLRFVPIAEVARRLNITPRTLRHYQDQGLIGSHRIARNMRAYDPDTVATLETIVDLRDAGLSITVIRDVLTLSETPKAQTQALKNALKEILAAKQRQVAKVKALLDSLSDPSAAPFGVDAEPSGNGKGLLDDRA